MNAKDIVNEFEQSGIRLWSEDGQLRYRAPQGALTEERRRILVANKAKLIDYLEADNTLIVPDPDKRFDPYPLTPMQAAYQLGRHGAFNYGEVPCSAYIEIEYEGNIASALEIVWNEIVERHDALRTVINGDDYQRVLESVGHYSISVIDACGVGGDALEDAVDLVRDEMVSAQRDASSWPLFDLRATVADEKTILHFFIELVVVDAASVQILLSEIDRGLTDRLSEPVSVTFRDYVIAERRLRTGFQFQRDQSYWMERIDHLPFAPELPLAPSSKRDLSFEGFYRLDHRLTEETWNGLMRQAKSRGITLSVAVLAAYAETIGRWSRHRRFTINVPVFNRLPLHEDIGEIVGDFTSVSLLEVDLDVGATSFLARALAIGGQLYEDLEHRLFSGLDVMAEIGRRKGATPLFPVVFTSTIDSAVVPARAMGKFRRGLTQTPQVWIDCQLMANGREGLLSWDVRRGILPNGVAEDAYRSFINLIERLAIDDNAWESTSPLSLPEAQKRVRALVNSTDRPLSNQPLCMRIVDQAKTQPDKIAVVDACGEVTYAELIKRAYAVADALISFGHRRADHVAICMEKGSEQISSALGVGIAGGAYVPIDPNQPARRRNSIIESARSRLILIQSWVELDGELPAGTTIIKVDELPEVPSARMTYEKPCPDDLAYVIYTSGSTGVPKGVEISHRAMANTVLDINSRFEVTGDDCVLGLASFSFDLSVYDVFGLLSAGGCVVLPDANRANDPSHWGELIVNRHVTIWNSVPAQAQMMHDYVCSSGMEGSASFLRLMLLSGDWIPLQMSKSLKKAFPGVEVISLGGATEASIWSIFYPIREIPAGWTSVPYGTPLSNQRFRILDSALQDCPDLVTGELYIGGKGLATGYLGDAQKTKERFIVHPDGERLYRTGDYGRYHPDGTIEFLGREDNQIKIRGYRVELGEVESALRGHPAISDAAAISVKDGDKDAIVGFAQLQRLGEPQIIGDVVANAAKSMCEELESKIDSEKFQELMSDIDETAIKAMLSELRAVGLFNAINETETKDHIARSVNVAPAKKRLLFRWLDALVDANVLRFDEEHSVYYRCAEIGDWREPWNRVLALGESQGYGTELLKFLSDCLTHLDELLRGQTDVRDVLFPEGEFGAARAVYTENVVGHTVNSIAASAVQQAASAFHLRCPHESFRILEVGAGIAGTTMEVVRGIERLPVEYYFTDISDFFLSEARKTFSQYAWMHYGIFDINAGLVEQGYFPNTFDVILCANVLHNSQDASEVLRRLKALLAPCGYLIFIEPIRRHNYSQLVSMEFEFTREDFVDERADSGQSFFTRNQWVTLLEDAGADSVCCIPENASVLSLAGQGVFVVRFKSDIAFTRYSDIRRWMKSEVPNYMVPDTFYLVDDLPRTSNGKTDRAALRKLLGDGRGKPVEELSAPTKRKYGDGLSSKIAAIWEELLGVSEIREGQDFYSLGGDSLLLSRMVGRVRENIPEAAKREWAVLLRQMLQDPTIEGLSAFLGESRSEAIDSGHGEARSNITILHAGEGGPAFVLTHAGTGTLQPYQALIPKMREKGGPRIWGIEITDIEEYLDLPPELAISVLANRYARMLLERGNKFVIAGYCIGGFLAAEIARLMLEAGADVLGLVAISSSRPPLVTDELLVEYLFARSMGSNLAELDLPQDSEEFARAIRSVLSDSPGLVSEGSLMALEGEYKKYGDQFCRFGERDFEQRISTIYHTSSAVGVYNAGSYSERDFIQLYKVFRQSLLAAAHYQPEPYVGRSLLLRNTESSSLLPGEKDEPETVWSAMCVGDFEIRDLEGNHFNCMGSSNAKMIADAITGAAR